MLIMVVDGQGGGVGRAVIESLLPKLPAGCELYAFGTNSVATGAMKKAGAHAVATGENSICYYAGMADIIVGSIGIVAANSIMGELSPAMATAIASSRAVKVLIPMNQCNLRVAGLLEESLPARIAQAVNMVLDALA